MAPPSFLLSTTQNAWASSSSLEHCGSSSSSSGRSRRSASPGRQRSQLCRSWLALIAAGLPGVETALADINEPPEEDLADLRGAMTAVNRIGDFPSRVSLQEAEDRLTKCLERWRARGDAASPEEVSSILRFRSIVRRRAGEKTGADDDLRAALAELQRLGPAALARSEEPPRVYMARGEAAAGEGRWEDALADFDKTAELLGEPLEDPHLSSARGDARRHTGDPEGAAADFEASAAMYKKIGSKPEAEIEAEHAAVALLGAKKPDLQEVAKRLNGVIRRTIGLTSPDVGILQKVVLADVDARALMAAVSWKQSRTEVAETYWRDMCARLDALVDDALTKQGTAGFRYGTTFRCDRYFTDQKWLLEDCGWPATAVVWLQDFLTHRTGPPRQSYLDDLALGIPPGER